MAHHKLTMNQVSIKNKYVAIIYTYIPKSY